ncbi:MAG: cupin domain-containing protein [Verrucomicrobiae bacterium]|nr:cupin domain-containing protein [Verrucomicrobiae bacterium]
MTAEQIIHTLKLTPLPHEGGFYAETYRSAFSTAIYYLLTPESFSALHRIRHDELFHFYLGDPVEMLQLWPDGAARTVILGSDLASGQRPQVLVPADVWQGARLLPGGAFALLGTTVAPPFDWSHFELAERQHLLNAYPDHRDAICRLTR